VPISLIASLLIALLLNQGVKGQSLWRTIYYLPSIVSGVAVSVLWAWIFQPDVGLLNTILRWFGIAGPRWLESDKWAMPALIIVSLWGVGGGMLIYLAGLQGIPTALYEAAEIDGAGPVAKFFHVTIPMMTPTIFFNLVMGIIGSWQVFTQAYVMTRGGPNNATLTAVLQIYNTGFMLQFFGYASAMAVGLFFVILVFVAIGLKTAGSWVQYERV
jgi:multiple sugar transport system permease protein